MAARLHFDSYGDENSAAIPLVFLHGFGGLAGQWQSLAQMLSSERRVLAFDLPGHGGSLDYPGGERPKLAAEAVIGELKHLGIKKVHLCGHSMGGAISCIIMLFAPEMVASATLLGPGGFGDKINAGLLNNFARAKTREEIEALFQQFFSDGSKVPEAQIDALIVDRQKPGASENLIKIADKITQNGTQGSLDLIKIAETGVPICVIWGKNDQMVPIEQSQNLPDEFRLHTLENVGHNPQDEAPEFVLKALREMM